MSQRDADLRAIERGIKALDAVLGAELPEPEDQPAFSLVAKCQCDAARAMTGLLERRSKLLGLDARPGDEQATDAETPMDRVLRVARG